MTESMVVDFSIGLIVVSAVFGAAVLVAWAIERISSNNHKAPHRPTHRNAPIKTVRRSY